METNYSDDYDPCGFCLLRDSCDGWEAAICVTANPSLMDDPDYDPWDI